MQKASLPNDIIRFRRYLGEQYTDPSNTVSTPDGIKGLQIYCLYFLGQGLGIHDAPVLEINPNVKDVATSKIITEKSDFIESLHHKTWIIQINCLKERRRNELEQLLSVFDQSNITADWHILNIKEDDLPEKFRPIIRRLKSAASNSAVKRQMKAEDEFIRYLKDCIRVARDKALEKNKKSLIEKEKTIEEKNKSLAEKDRSLAEKDKENENLKNELEKLKRKLSEK
jgi:septal ring factor EnvC (AmiA/AmiB activator)